VLQENHERRIQQQRSEERKKMLEEKLQKLSQCPDVSKRCLHSSFN